MTDPRFTTLAHNLSNYSLEIQPGDKVLIEASGRETEFTRELIKAVYQAKGKPFFSLNSGPLLRQWLLEADEEMIAAMGSWEAARMKEMDCYIGVRLSDNIYDMAGLPQEQLKSYNLLWQKPVHHELRVPHTRWVVLRYPNHSMAQEAQMSSEQFADFYFDVCNLDYARLSRAMDPLYYLLQRVDRIEILAPGTELTFSIKEIGAVKCDGHRNIPDGEVYTAPVKDSLEGYITYNIPSTHQGEVFSDIRLEFSQGKIIKAGAGSKTAKLNAILDTDPGARYIGEFAFGLNPQILTPSNDILFDEKICGSIHLTPGACYEDASNGNLSAIHWDLVTILREEYGGGEIYCDGVLIQKNGLFCVPELESLNPQRLQL
ncbi:MAG: aminopeptidase [Clostridiales bacterium]|jgi:aminopeptidase|nr:aminopeptidase [Clostridiales bacterium]MDR2713481.1 aminopeptidase [Clostridiales bacterium]